MKQTSDPLEMSDGHRYWNGDGGDTWARTMDVSERNFESMTNVLMRSAQPQPGEQVLDVGCGGGVTSKALAELVTPAGEVTGLDISDTILDIAKQRHGAVENLTFQQADVGAQPLASAHYDLIYSRFGVMFFDDPAVAFKNLHQALKSDGRLVFMCWRAIKDNPWLYATTAAAVAELPEEHRPSAPADPFAPGPFSLADLDHTHALLRKAGFNDVRMNKLDDVMRLGDEQSALGYLTELGPVGSALKKVPPEQAVAARQAMLEVLRSYATDAGLNVPSATWIVTAKA